MNVTNHLIKHQPEKRNWLNWISIKRIHVYILFTLKMLRAETDKVNLTSIMVKEKDLFIFFAKWLRCFRIPKRDFHFSLFILILYKSPAIRTYLYTFNFKYL